MGLVVWSVAFNLGAFGVVFFKDVFAVVVTATVALLVSFVVPEVFAGPLWAVRLLLASPAAWLIAAVTIDHSVTEAATDPVLGPIGLCVALAATPYTLWLMITALVPQLDQIRGHRLALALAGIVVVVGTAGWLVGQANHHFLHCDDFTISGNDRPRNCANLPASPR